MNCVSRNFRRKIFSQIWLRQTFREFLFSWLSKRSCILHRVDHWVSLSMSTNNHYQYTFGMKSLSTYKSTIYMYYTIKLKNTNILLIEIFIGIFISIACWDHHSYCLSYIDKSSKFENSVILTCIGGAYFV